MLRDRLIEKLILLETTFKKGITRNFRILKLNLRVNCLSILYY